jgi:serine/threonine protein kinase
MMSTPWTLQYLYSLDTSSPDFLRHLRSLIDHDEKEQYLTSLQGSELARLVDFLDKVYAVPSAFYRFTKQTP